MSKKISGSTVHHNDTDAKSMTKNKHGISNVITTTKKEVTATPTKKKDLLILGVLKTRHEV